MIYGASWSPYGIDLIEVEAQKISGPTGVCVVGASKSAVKDAKERAKTALEVNKVQLFDYRLILSLSPPESIGDTFSLDLAMALAIFRSVSQPVARPAKTLFLAQLDLHGTLKPTEGFLAFLVHARDQVDQVICSPQDGEQAVRLAQKIPGFFPKLIPASTLADVLAWSRGEQPLTPIHQPPASTPLPPARPHPALQDSFLDGRMLPLCEWTLTGRLHLLLYGEPGCGKTYLARKMGELQPALTLPELQESLTKASIQRLPSLLLSRTAPFEAPHHKSSYAALLGNHKMQGALARAHQGILFLDEICEVHRDVLEALREPLEKDRYELTRGSVQQTVHTRFQLIAAMNPCPCGFFGASGHKICSCRIQQVRGYLKKISGPFSDRIHLKLDLKRWLAQQPPAEPVPMAKVQERIAQLRHDSVKRNQRWGFQYNSQARFEELDDLAGWLGWPPPKLRQWMEEKDAAYSKRSILLNIILARTMADCAASDPVTDEHMQDAFAYLDRFTQFIQML